MLPNIMKSHHMHKFLLVIIGVIIFADVLAIDGNYAAPYGSQWDSRSQIALIPLETVFGGLLVILNLVAAATITLRARKRRQ
jgi:hypothetical protein